MKRMESAGWRWIVITGVAGIAAGVNLGACTIGEIPIGGDNVGQAGDDGSGGTSGSGGTGGTTGGTGDTGGTSGSGGTSAGFSSCEEVRQATDTALAQIQACSSDAECGQVLAGTSCGCTRNQVARLDADTSSFEELLDVSIEGELCSGFVSTCDCPAADGFACENNRCTWNYTSPSASSCNPQDARGVGTCEPHLGARWNGAGCEIVWGCSCEGADCDDLWPSNEECAAAQQHCFDNATCSDERKEMRDLLNANKACTTTADCQTLYVGCGVTEDDCTGAVYANQSLDAEQFDAKLDRLNTCSTSFEGFGCANCERAARQAECIDGLCLGANTCALEASAVSHFIGENNACTEDDDCVQEMVGCEVTQDDCTGAVYLAAGFDDAEFKALREEYYACKGVDSCSACLRTISPPACVGGFCQHR